MGNNRLSYTYETATSSIKILEENHYYPFGLKHTKYNINQANYGVGGAKVIPVPKLPFMYKYNGKELQDELGLNMYDYGARGYMPDIGRFSEIDPLAEKSSRWTPYSYCLDNPLNMIDPDGRDPVTTINSSSNYTLTYNGKNNYTLTNVSNTNVTTTNDDGSSTVNSTSKTTNVNYTMSENKNGDAVMTVTGGSVQTKATQTINTVEPYNGVVNGSGRTSVTNTIVDITKPMNADKASSTMNGDKNLNAISKGLQSYHQINGAFHSIFMDPKNTGVNPLVPVTVGFGIESIKRATTGVGIKNGGIIGAVMAVVPVLVDYYYSKNNERSKGRTAVINPRDDK